MQSMNTTGKVVDGEVAYHAAAAAAAAAAAVLA